ncbi:hypothetical protein, partial [uncultured Megasphaera sp.]|uniref:hypothetical protein n=1 Tax=uncultured Megasphaera sp. TaxID=165188 RepID=UPI0026E0749E
FSRGKTPIYVNYVIAHNTQRAARSRAPLALFIGELSAKLTERLLFLLHAKQFLSVGVTIWNLQFIDNGFKFKAIC